MKISQILILVFGVFTTRLTSQVGSVELVEAEALFENKQFSYALPHYLNLLKNDVSNEYLNYKAGICYLNSRSQKGKSVSYLKKAVGDSVKGSFKSAKLVPIVAYKLLGDAYLLSYNFTLAKEQYEKFKGIVLSQNDKDLDIEILEEVGWKMEMCKLGEELSANGKKLSMDEKFFENFNTSINDSLEAGLINIQVSEMRDSLSEYETTVATSVDGQIMLIYKNDNGNGSLYVSSLSGNQWTLPEKLDRPVNTSGWELNECISADGSIMYFTSDREEGFGGKDIYRSKRMHNGEWSKAVNLGPIINSSRDDEAPFIHPDGATLFFSSNRNDTINHFNVFTSSLTDSGYWTTPVNVGYPVNKTSNNVFYPLIADNKNTHYTSFKETPYPVKKNYRITFVDHEEAPLTLMKGEILDSDGNVPRNAKITVTDNGTEHISGIYSLNNKTGQYLFVLPPGINNNITYEADGYLFCSRNMDISAGATYYEITKPVKMNPIRANSRTVLNNIFFDSGKAGLRSISHVELNRLVQFLATNPSLMVELSSYVDTRESSKHDMKLSRDRAQAVINYLVEKGINKKRLIPKGYGKYKHKKSEEMNSLEAKQLDQRVELKIIEVK